MHFQVKKIRTFMTGDVSGKSLSSTLLFSMSEVVATSKVMFELVEEIFNTD